MRVFVTGATGMVGRTLVELLARDSGHEPLTPGRRELDLLDSNAVRTFLERERPDVIVHCAGKVGGIAANVANPVDFLVTNTLLGFNVLLAAHEVGIERVINLATSCMYPKDVEGLLTEELLLTAPLEPTNEGYALAKISVAKLTEYLASSRGRELYKTNVPCNLYGPYDNFDLGTGHLIASAIRKVHDAKRKGARSVEVWGDGTARREFLFVGDYAQFLRRAVDELGSLPAFINVGAGDDHSVRDYYETACEVIGYDGTLEFDLTRPTGMKRKLMSSARVNAWGWAPRTSLRDGMAHTYSYFVEHHG